MRASFAARCRGSPGGPMVCVARPNGAAGPRSGRPAAPRAAPTAVEAPPQAAAAPAAPAQAAAVGATPVPLPPALQGTLVQPRVGTQTAENIIENGNVEAGSLKKNRGPRAEGEVQGKRRDRRRRRLAKQRAAATAAAAAAAVAAGAVIGRQQQVAQQQEREQQQERQRKQQARRQRRAAAARSEGGEGAAAAVGSREARKEAERERQIPISRKAEDLMMWYSDVTAAAEQAHKSARATWRGRGLSKGSAAGGAPQAQAQAPSPAAFSQSLQAPLQACLADRLDYMGFQTRQFPQLQPLDVTRKQLQQEQEEQQQQQQAQKEEEEEVVAAEEGGGSSSSSLVASSQDEADSSSCGPGSSSSSSGATRLARGCTTSTFTRWAAAARGQLPLLASQWHRGGASWELFDPSQLLQEAHAAHEWGGSAEEHARSMIGMYEEFVREAAALPVVAGRMPASSSMPGAAASYTLEAMVGEGLALQVASSHHLADNYSRLLLGSPSSSSSSSEEQHEDDGQQQLLSQMGSGLHSSLLGGMALTHGDDAGLQLPPELAPVQVGRCWAALASAGVRVAVDWRRRGPAGVRFGDSERRGVPLRVELGPRDLKGRTCVIAQRHLGIGRGSKLEGVSTDPDALVDTVRALLEDRQADLRWDAASALQEGIVDVGSFLELRDAIEAGKWARGPWAGSRHDEAAVQEETGASLLCFPLVQPTSMWGGFNTCLYSGYQASEVAIFARLL